MDDFIDPKLDLDKLATLCTLQASNQEIAAYFKVRLDILEEFYREVIEEGRSKGLINIRTWQMEQAQKGDIEMLKWLGQQYLRQTPHNK